jgi:hypothetical protein
MSLPRSLTSMVGREPELPAVRALLARVRLAITFAAAHLCALIPAASLASSRITTPPITGASPTSTPIATRLGESEV